MEAPEGGTKPAATPSPQRGADPPAHRRAAGPVARAGLVLTDVHTAAMLTYANILGVLTYVNTPDQSGGPLRPLSPHDIGALARQARAHAGLTQEALATMIGASRFWVAEFERGKARAELGLTLKALRALGLTLRIERTDGTRTPSATASPRAERGGLPRVDLARLLARAALPATRADAPRTKSRKALRPPSSR